MLSRTTKIEIVKEIVCLHTSCSSIRLCSKSVLMRLIQYGLPTKAKYVDKFSIDMSNVAFLKKNIENLVDPNYDFTKKGQLIILRILQMNSYTRS